MHNYEEGDRNRLGWQSTNGVPHRRFHGRTDYPEAQGVVGLSVKDGNMQKLSSPALTFAHLSE